MATISEKCVKNGARDAPRNKKGAETQGMVAPRKKKRP